MGDDVCPVFPWQLTMPYEVPLFEEGIRIYYSNVQYSRFFCTHRREILRPLCPVFRGTMHADNGVVCSSDEIEFCGQRQG